MSNNWCVKANDEQSVIDNSNTSSASCLDNEGADERVKRILVEQISPDWMKFAHRVCLNAFYNIVEEIQNNNNNNQLKLKIFLQKINEINPLNFNEVIANCLYTLKRFDILLCVALDEKFEKVKKFLIEHLSTDWKKFAQETHLINIETIIEHIDRDNKDDKCKMASFLKKLFEIEPFQFKDIIRNSLSTLEKFNTLFGVALDENDETVKRILMENVSGDWKRLAQCTCLHNIDSVVEQIDHDYDNDQLKMAAFLDKLYELDSLNYKKLVVNSLNAANRFDVLFRLALVESSEIVMKLLVERASSDWKSFAFSVYLHEVNCIIDNIDQENDCNQMKMKALLKKLFNINQLHFKELIKSTLITMKRFSVLSAFKEDCCHGKGEEKKKKAKEETKPAPSSSPCTGATDEDKEKVVVLKDQEKMSDVDNSELLLQLGLMVKEDWMALGRFLSVKDHELDVIDLEYDDLKEKAHRMLWAWKNQQKFPTFDALAKAIHKINRLDLITVMEKFLNKSFETEILLKPSIEDKAEICGALKRFYQTTYGKMDQLEHNLISSGNVDLLNKFVELTVVDANEAESDIVNIAERNLFLHRQTTYKPIEFYEVFSKELPLLLISGIAGIGKTCLLRKCLLDWASNTLWKKLDFVFYLECRKLNQCQNITSINELLKVFYKNVFIKCNVCEDFSILFVIDGLDEFAYLDELINHSPLIPSSHSIVNVLADILDFHKYKCVVAGRVGAILQYKNKMTECREKLVIQIMGFNDLGINEYVERVGNAKEAIKQFLKSSQIAKAMASVPFYLSAMCTVIGSSMLRGSYSFFSTTELYCCIFLYFLQKHINKNNEPVYKLMERESSKQYILNVCKVAWHFFNENKVVFSQKEMEVYFKDNDKTANGDLGFIEKVESQLGFQYQFVHLTLMEFCASIYARYNLSPEEIISNKSLRRCLPMICGLKKENGGAFLRLLANLKTSKKENNSMLDEGRTVLLDAVLSLIRKPFEQLSYSKYDDANARKMFMECFFEMQASMTEDLKRSINEREWWIDIRDGKTAHEVSHEKYFMEKYFEAGCKLFQLYVNKKILSEDDQNFIILCSTNVHSVLLKHPVKIDGWTPQHEMKLIKYLHIDIKDTFVSKNEFEGYVLPWIRLAEKLVLDLHKNTNFISDICKWLRGSIFDVKINYRGNIFCDIEEFEVRNKKKCLVT